MHNPLYDTLFDQHKGSDSIFLIRPDGTTLSYDQFLRLASRFANVLKGHGIKPGDRVAAQVSKSVEALALYAACVQSGAVFLPLNTAYTPTEVSYFVEDSVASLVICDPSQEEALAAIASAHAAKLLSLDAQGNGTFNSAAKDCADAFDTVARSPDDLAALLYTSGTTGRSKGAMMSQKNLLSNAQALVELWQFTSDDILLHALPIFHTHGLFVATNVSLLAGGAMIFLPRFDQDDIIRLLPKATSFMGVPTFYTRLLNDERFTQPLVKHMRLFISGSAPLLAETHLEFEQRTGHRILERYGMTETNMITSNPYVGERLAGTVGHPLPGVEIKVCDAQTGEQLATGEVGIVEVRGENVFRGYWNMPEKTAEEIREDGFFITGDLGQIDQNGYLSIVGRGKDLIISGGFNIYPKEIELLLDEQPDVLESAVVGVPHPDFGEGVVGVLVAKPNSDIDVDSIKAAMATALAKFKQPKRLVVVNELPRNTMGKVQKNILRERYKESFT